MFWRESVLLQQLDMIPTSATQYPWQEIYDFTHTHIHVNQILHAIHNITHIRQGSGNPAVIRCELSLSQASLTNSFV